MKYTLFRSAGPLALCLHAATCTAASLSTMASDNSSLIFLGIDSKSATVTSMVADLGYFLTDVGNSAGLFQVPGSTVVWDFGHDTLSINGVSQSGTYNWSAAFDAFNAVAAAGNTQWAVIAGAKTNFPQTFLTTGNPTSTQLSQQTKSLTSAMGLVDALINNANNASGSGITSTFGLTGLGAEAEVGLTTAASGYVGAASNFNTAGTWQTKLKWSAYTNAGSGTSPLWSLTFDAGTGSLVGPTALAGVFNYNAGVLTWTTAPVPEPNGYLVLVAGFAILAYAGRRLTT